MKTIGEITKQYRQEWRLSGQAFADALCEKMKGVSKTRQNVSQWENDTGKPEYLFVILVHMSYSDWRRDWALDVLTVLKPHIWSATSDNMTPVTF